MNKYKYQYYDDLEKSSDGWYENKNDYIPFTENFLSTLYMCYRELNTRFSVVSGKAVPKNKRIESAVFDSLVPVSKSDICEILPDVSPTTVEAVLGKMVRDGRIRKTGVGRSTKYIRN